MSILDAVASRGIVLVGCGKMGGALLSGWIEAGLPASSASIVDPYPGGAAKAFAAQGAHLNPDAFPDNPSAVVVAVKPQLIEEALPLVAWGEQTAEEAMTAVMSEAVGRA